MISSQHLLSDVREHPDRTFPTPALLIPARLELVDGCLQWDWFDEGVGPREIQQNRHREPLRNFIALAEAEEKAILRYAREWGVLGLCEHLVPSAHSRECRPIGWPDCCTEPITAWRRYAKEASILIKLSLDLARGTPPKKQDWAALPLRRSPRSVEAGRLLVAERVNQWLAWGGVRPTLTWRKDAPEMSLGGTNLFGVLAIQLMCAVSRTDGVAICCGCGAGYLPPYRKPRDGERHYCEECRRRKVPQRDAARDFRSRKLCRPTRSKRRKAG